MTATRIYRAFNAKTETELLVRASSPVQAVRYVAEKGWEAAVATQDQLVELALKGAEVLDATKAE